VAQKGFLLIADITGYTMFLTRSELEHAQGILDTLFKSIFAEIKAPIILSNLQGDAALTHLPDVNLPQRQFPLDAIERIYCSFANTLGDAARLRRKMVERVLTHCGTDLRAAEPLMILLRRFATESAREEARLFCDELLSEETITHDLIAA